MSTKSDTALDGMTAIITGASSGIGKATAKALSEQGASVVVAARRVEELETLADHIESTGGEALVVPTDITNQGDITQLVMAATDQFGSIDVLVNNAGVMLLEPLDQADDSNLQQMVEVNLLGLMKLTRAVLSVMQRQDGGHIVTLSSVAGRTAFATSTGYSATKFGVTAFTEALRREITDQGIRTTTIEPGAVATELYEHVPNEESKQEMLSLVDSITPLEGDDIADAITYAVTRPQHVSINELLIRPTEQIEP